MSASKTITAKQLSDLIRCDQISKKRDGTGNFIFRKGYFYTHGGDEQQLADRIEQECKLHDLNVEIIDKGNHWAAFSGGASVAKSSHWWVVAKVTKKS